jgi:hypothetical protein
VTVEPAHGDASLSLADITLFDFITGLKTIFREE